MGVTKFSFSGETLITVPVLVEGVRSTTIVMAIDTGATYTMIPWKIAQSIGVEPETTKRRILITTASSTEEAPLVTLPRIFVLGKELTQVAAIVHDLPSTSRIDGLLGLNVLFALRMKIDFAEQVIEIP